MCLYDYYHNCLRLRLQHVYKEISNLGAPTYTRTSRTELLSPAPVVVLQKTVQAPFFSSVPQIMSMAPGWMSCPWRSWTWQRNWAFLVVNFDHPGCHHKWNHWISFISWPAQEIESRESTVGSSVGWRCKAGTEARWPRHLDWQNFVQYLLIAISNWIFQFEKMEALWPCLTSSASQWMLRGWW